MTSSNTNNEASNDNNEASNDNNELMEEDDEVVELHHLDNLSCPVEKVDYLKNEQTYRSYYN